MLSFTIPHFRIDTGKVLVVDFMPMQNELIEYLKSKGVSYHLCERGVSFDGKFLDESIVQADTDDDSVVDFFKSLLLKYHYIFMHSFYVYDCNGESHSLYVIDDKVLTCNEVCQILSKCK